MNQSLLNFTDYYCSLYINDLLNFPCLLHIEYDQRDSVLKRFYDVFNDNPNCNI